MNIAFPGRVNLALLPTPLQPLERLTEHLGGPRLWIKRDDLTGCTLAGNKVRKLEFVLAEARRQGADTLITVGGIQSNHCRATAIAGARLGMRVHLVLRGEASAPVGNHFLDIVAGAKISYLDPVTFSEHRDDHIAGLVESYAANGRKAFVIPMGASDALGAWGYIEMTRELRAQAEASKVHIDHIVTATGSGGTQAGLVAGNALAGSPSEIWGVNVCDNADYFTAKIRGDFDDWCSRWGHPEVSAAPINMLDGYVGEGYAIATPQTWATIRLLAHLEGILLDPVYSGKAFAGLLAEISQGRFMRDENVVFVHTGGVFGLMAQSSEYMASLADKD